MTQLKCTILSSLISIVCIFHFGVAVNRKWLGEVVHNMLSKEKISHITAFLNKKNNANSTEINFIYKNLIAGFPTISIIIEDTKNFNDNNRSVNLPIFRNPRSTTIYVIIQHQNEFAIQIIKNNLQFFVQLSPLHIRPKCLVILFNDSNSVKISEDQLQELLEFAWSLKFLDFVILTVSNDSDAVTIEYNPFTSLCNKNYVNSTREIFPDKLRNMNGYILNTIWFSLPPYMFLDKNSYENLTYTGIHYAFIQTLSTSLNYTINIIDKYKTPNFKNLFSKLKNEEYDITPLAILMVNKYYNKDILFGRPFLNDFTCLSVPIFSVSKIDNLGSIFIYMSLSVAIIYGVVLISKLLGFDSKNWTSFNIFRVLLAIVTSKRPKKLKEMCIYLSLALISIKYSADVVAILTDDKIMREIEITFNALDEINKPTLPIYISKYWTKNREEFYRNVNKINSAADCFKILIKSRNCSCIAPINYATYFINEFKDNNGIPIIKIAQPKIFDDYRAFTFQKGSPFVDKFDRKFQSIIESGIFKTWKYVNKDTKSRSQTDIIFIKEGYLKQLIILLSMGYLNSLIIFILEIYKNKMRTLKRKY